MVRSLLAKAMLDSLAEASADILNEAFDGHPKTGWLAWCTCQAAIWAVQPSVCLPTVRSSWEWAIRTQRCSDREAFIWDVLMGCQSVKTCLRPMASISRDGNSRSLRVYRPTVGDCGLWPTHQAIPRRGWLVYRQSCPPPLLLRLPCQRRRDGRRGGWGGGRNAAPRDDQRESTCAARPNQSSRTTMTLLVANQSLILGSPAAANGQS